MKQEPQKKFISSKRKERKQDKEQMGKTKNKQQMIDLNQTMSIMTLNVNGLNALIKSRDCQTGLKKARTNFVLSIRTHFKTLDTNLFLI